MSEYQYYEFQAVDRPLDARELSAVRSCSSRATISSTRFVNSYNWGDFKGSVSEWMERYYDAFAYLANWGTRQFQLRLPARLLDLATAKLYCPCDPARARKKGEFVILEFESDDDGDGDWDDDGSGWLGSLVSLRADIAAGDYRALYLGWLLCAQSGALDDDAVEPPLPPELAEPTAALEAFTDFLRIDEDWLGAAAIGSATGMKGDDPEREIRTWIAGLASKEKDRWLLDLATGKTPNLRAELLREFRMAGSASQTIPRVRTVAEIRHTAERIAKARRRKEAQRAAEDRVRRQREEAERREKALAELAKREPAAWKEVDAFIRSKKPIDYDKAVALLMDLADLGKRRNQAEEAEARIRTIRETYASRPALIRRLDDAGLGRLPVRAAGSAR